MNFNVNELAPVAFTVTALGLVAYLVGKVWAAWVDHLRWQRAMSRPHMRALADLGRATQSAGLGCGEVPGAGSSAEPTEEVA